MNNFKKFGPKHLPNRTDPPIITGIDLFADTPRLLTKKETISAMPTDNPARIEYVIPLLS